jgi:hypothetical protein
MTPHINILLQFHIKIAEDWLKTEVHIMVMFTYISQSGCSYSLHPKQFILSFVSFNIKTEILYEAHPYFQCVVPSCEDVALDVAGDVEEVLVEPLELHHAPPVLW